MRNVPLALRLLKREWRHGELRLFTASLILAVATATMISLFADRLGRAVRLQSADLLGADLILESSTKAPAAWLDKAGETLQVSRTLEFGSVVNAEGGFRLASIKAVDDQYPLRGQLKISDTPFSAQRDATPPQRGTVWAETRLLQDLDTAVGDTIQLGNANFTLAAVLALEPSRGGSFFNLSPRLLMHLDDIPATQILQPGSRVKWRYLFAGEAQDIQQYQAWLAERLEQHQRLIGLQEGRPGVSRALQRGESFLGLATLAAVALAGIAISLTARRYAERHRLNAALLRCFGLQRRPLLRLYSTQLLLLSLLGLSIGLLLGWLGEALIIQLFREALPSPLPNPGLQPFVIGALVGMVVLFAFALPPIRALAEVPPLQVMQQATTPLSINRFIGFVIGLTGLSLLAFWLIDNSRVVLLFALTGIGLTLLAQALTHLMQRVTRNRSVAIGPAYGLRNVGRHASLSAIQLIAFTLTLLLMATLAGLRGSLLEEWQQQLPDDTPNHFAINIQPYEKQDFAEALNQLPIQQAQLYPMVRGRLTELNGTAIRDAVPEDAQDDGSLRRELNLTWTDTLPAGNRIVRGQWHTTVSDDAIPVSIEQGLAERLAIKLGDAVSFRIGAASVSATVTSVRTVEWESFQPNFFMIFPPGALDDYPHTYMTSFYLPSEQRAQLNELARQFPAVTLIDIELLLTEFRKIQNQVIMAIEYILLFVLATGALVTIAAVINTLDTRRHETALLRSMGATNRQLRTNVMTEFGMLGLVSGVIAALGSEALRYYLFVYQFELDTAFNPAQLLWLPPLSAIAIALLGLWATRDILKTSPLKLMAGN